MMDVDTRGTEKEVVEAREIFLLMKDEYRISRNTRASWYLKNLNGNIEFTPKQCLSDLSEELEILSIKPSKTYSVSGDGSLEKSIYLVTPNTSVTFLAKRCKMAFILDVSPSVAAVDQPAAHVLFDEIYDKLRDAIKGVIKPFHVPDCAVLFAPQIYITVVAHTSLIKCQANQVLLHGCLITEENVDTVLEQVKSALENFEQHTASSLAEVVKADIDEDEDEVRLTGGLFDDIIERPESPNPNIYMMSPEANFINMLRYGILALQLLPENTTSSIIIITDGIVGLPDASLFESLMTQLRHSTISCSFVQVGSGFHTKTGLGQVPYPELLEFIAMATFGAYFSKLPVLAPDSTDMNPMHHALLTWSFQKAMDCFKYDSNDLYRDLMQDLVWTSWGQSSLKNGKTKWKTPLMRKKHQERNLHTPISNLISCRLREGYTIKDVSFTKGDSQIEVRMVLPWRDGVRLHYAAVSSWPLTTARRNTHVEVTIEAHYYFLHDVTCPMKQPFKSAYRNGLVKKYWQTLQGMSETDQLLIHLQSFASNPMYYTVPENVKKGIPLFILPPNSTYPQLNIQLSSKDSSLNQFASFWKPVLMLDVNIWQKWMHTHRVGVILEHDMPLGKHLHIPNSSGRFHTIMCRQALTSLNFFLREWSTFVLMENHSYITLLFNEQEKPPTSFYVMRVTSKQPCLVLRVAFIGGTPGHLRNEIVCQLRDRLNSLTFPQRGTEKDGKSKKLARRQSEHDMDHVILHKPPLQRLWSEIPCCILTRKPVEKILIKYERVPQDYTTMELAPLLDHSGHLAHVSNTNRAATHVFTTLSRYLYHRRWIWSVQLETQIPISMGAIGKILSTLTKIRLQEGFNFAHANSGAVSMVVEVEVKGSETGEDFEHKECEEENYPSVVQYVVFPPHTTTTRESISEDDLEEVETTEADGELQIITECWVEPQYGTVVNSTPERKHFDGLNYKQLAQATFPTDLECISSLITFEHLNLMCQNCAVPSPVFLGEASTPAYQHSEIGSYSSLDSDRTIQQVQFPFDLMRLLPKCQQVELLFSTFIQDTEVFPMLANRRGTLTSENLESSKSPGECIGCPNCTLFHLLLSDVAKVHDREVHITDWECEELINLVKQRDRDCEEYPFPFPTTELNSDEATQLHTDAAFENRSESTLSLTTSISSVLIGQSQSAHTLTSQGVSQSQTSVTSKSGTDINQPRVHTPMMVGKEPENAIITNCNKTYKHGCHVQNQRLMEIKHEDGVSKTGGARTVPKWRCFIKSLANNHILICFIPASFGDLILLCGTNRTGGERKHSIDPSTLTDIFSDPKPETESSDVEQGISVSERQTVAPVKASSIDASGATEQPDPNLGDMKHIQPPTLQHIADSDRKSSLEENDDMETTEESTESSNQFKSEKNQYNLPIYIYNCPLSVLAEQLVNRWTYSKPVDIFEDLSFKADESKAGSSTNGDKTKEGSEHGDEPSVCHRVRTISDHWRDRNKVFFDEAGTEDKYGDEKDLKDHCTLVSETYLRCFVSGVYKSIHASQYVDSHDVDAAINSICEESLPLEIDITKFVHCICVHARQLMEKIKLNRMLQEDLDPLKKLPIADSEEPELVRKDSSAGEKDHGDEDEMRFPMTLLQGTFRCETDLGLHELVKRKFRNILSKYFKPVPSHSDYLYYCPPKLLERQTSEDIGEPNTVTILRETEADHKHKSVSDDSDVFGPYCDPEEKAEKGSEKDSVLSIKDSDCTSRSSLNSADLGDLNSLEEEIRDIPALFIYLTCSVRVKGCMLKSIPIRNIPTCLGELKGCLEEQSPEINLNDMHITLDVICLTLPQDVDLSDSTNRPCYERMTSYTSHMSNASVSPTPSDGQRNDSVSGDATNCDVNAVSKPLRNLSQFQKDDVTACKKQIQWLLTDEIASAHRLIVPVTAETLQMISSHVRTSVGKPMCLAEEVPFQFVYGSERSLAHFIEDFERINLPGYHLNKEGGFYYLHMDRARAAQTDFVEHAKILSSALENIDHPSPVPTRRRKHHSLVPQSSNPESGLHDTSSDAAISQRVAAEMHPQHEAKPTGDEAEEAARREDIRISITGPSPIKEQSKVAADRQQTEREPDDHMTDNSSANSITVLDISSREELTKEEAVSKSRHSSSEKSAGGQPVMEDAAVTDDQIQKPAGQQLLTSSPTKDETKVKEIKQDYSPIKEVGQSKAKTECSPGALTEPPLSVKPQSHINPPTELDKKGLKKAHSSASFEKYKSEKSKVAPQSSESQVSCWSGGTTPQRRPSEPQTPVRSRHQSGLQTPLSVFSAIEASSRSSVGEEEYDGGSSDSDDEGTMMSFSESFYQRPVLPKFWLILKIESDWVDVYFHTRDYEVEDNAELIQEKSLYNEVIKHIYDICKVVNQRLMLEELFKTRMCNPLLVPEADEDVKWTSKVYPGMPRRKTGSVSDSDSDTDGPHTRYLAATSQFVPGHFACPFQYQMYFPLHPRLKTGSGRTSISRGVQALRSVLDSFSVNNRKKMFIVQGSAGSIYYLRLRECYGDVRGLHSMSSFSDHKQDSESVFSVSRSSSVTSLTIRKMDEDEPASVTSPRKLSTTTDKEVDIMAATSASLIGKQPSSPKPKMEESITLDVYGITEVGTAISQDLFQLLQKRLDDAVLEIITLMLSRNPMCKLMKEDVDFIQIPNCAPSNRVQLTIPPSAMLHLYALVYYLRQNLQQFLDPPKYIDGSKAENVFRDYTTVKADPIPENDVFLYNRPPQSGGKGIACLHLSFVDGKRNKVNLIGSPKPSQYAYMDGIDKAVFESLIHTSVYKADLQSKLPGPTALVQFNIWERGSIDMSQLTDKLLQAMKHALCDIVMEYRLLTAPLCDVPYHYRKGMDSPMHSAPPSPVLDDTTVTKSTLSDESYKKQVPESGGRTPKEKTSLSFQTIMSDIFGAKTPKSDQSNVVAGNQGQTWQELEGHRRKETEIRQKIFQYEGGERGALHPTFCGVMADWMHFCCQLETAAINKYEVTLSSRSPVDYVLKDIHGFIHGLCQDINARIFKQCDSALGSDNQSVYIPYNPARHPSTHEAKSDSSLAMATPSSMSVPGKTANFVLVGRNVRQWRSGLDYPQPGDNNSMDLPSLRNPKTHKSYQRFQPLEPCSPTEKAEEWNCLNNAFIPRQRLLLIFLQDKHLTTYTYNLAVDLNSNFQKQLVRLVQWHNARTHLLSCILSQKMGLFHHTVFGDFPTDSASQESNPFVQSVGDVDLLVRYTSPPIDQIRNRSRSGSLAPRPSSVQPLHPRVPAFDYLFQDYRPPTPMQVSQYSNLRDPIHRHGAQMLELKGVEKKEGERIMKLENVYMMWLHKVGPAHITIAEDVLELLKNFSRLVHNVATPLLFSPQWRRQILGKSEVPKRQESQTSEPRTRSRHSSGASTKSKRSDSQDSRKRVTGLDSPDTSSRQSIQDEAWHIDLRSSFLSQYIQYLRSLSFTPVQTRPPSPKRTTRQTKCPERNDDESHPSSKSQYTYLQKTLPGGIMLLELTFRDIYFCVNVYAFECSRLPVGNSVNRQLQVIFTDECDKFKDLTHVHSFAHDFHLRTTLSFIRGRPHLVFKQGYHLTGFLQDFVKYFPYAPSFARNYIYEGNLMIENINISGHQLFEYMIRHYQLYDMRAIRMTPCSEDNFDLESDFALMAMLERHDCGDDTEALRAKPEDYDLGLVVTKNPKTDGNVLHLKYWLVLISKKEIFPKHNLEKKLGMFKALNTRKYPATGFLMSSSFGCDDVGWFESPNSEDDECRAQNFQCLSDSQPKMQQLVGRPESVNYLGYSNIHQTPIYALLLQESRLAKEKIQKMVDSAMRQCRRDLLWQRMLLGGKAEEAGRKKHKSDTEDTKDPYMTKLTFSEFEELLSVVTRESLADIDSRLTPLQNMSFQWYQGLLKVLTNKYEPHRLLSSVDGLIQYLVVLNPNYLDEFMMLELDSLGSRAELCAVYREPLENPEHSLDNPSLPVLAIQQHVEQFVNACCFHMWSGVLQ